MTGVPHAVNPSRKLSLEPNEKIKNTPTRTSTPTRLRRECGQPEVPPERVQAKVKEHNFGIRLDLVQLLQVRQLLAGENKGHVDIRPLYWLFT